MPLLVLESVCKAFRPGAARYGGLLPDALEGSLPAVEVLRGVDLRVEAGRVVWITGGNGSGKTTILKLCCGLLEADSGRVERVPRRGGTGGVVMAFSERRSFWGRLDAFENLRYARALSGAAWNPRLARTLLARFSIEDEALRRPVSTFSDGMLARLALVRALLLEPSVLLLDEPMASLDPEGAASLASLLEATGVEEWAPLAVLAVSPRGDEVQGLRSDELHLLEQGVLRPVEEGGGAGRVSPRGEEAERRGPGCVWPCGAEGGGGGAAAVLRLASGCFRKDLLCASSYPLAFLFQAAGLLSTVLAFFFLGELVSSSAGSGGAAAAAAHPSALAGYGGAYFPFVLVGLLMHEFHNTCVGGMSAAVRRMQLEGTLEFTAATVCSWRWLLPGTLLYPLAWTFLRASLCLGAALVLAGPGAFDAGGVPSLLAVLLVSGVLFCALGMASASFVLLLRKGNPVEWILSQAGVLLGGVYYPLSVLPSWLRPASALVPLTWALEAARHAVLPGHPPEPASSLLAALAAASVAALVSTWWCGSAFRRAASHGLFSGY